MGFAPTWYWTPCSLPWKWGDLTAAPPWKPLATLDLICDFLGSLRNATIHQTRKTWKISSMGRREIQWRFLNLGLLTMAYNCQDGKDYANDGLRTIGVCKEERGIPACKKKAQTAFLLWSIPVRTRGRIQRTASLIWAPNLENAHFYQRQAVKAWGGRLTPFFSWEWSWSPHR